ncbi:hypothetical protein LJ707_06840 [Mucilaginibacter sp. UR6-1]|uniref:hypothetical protein n=1 Tax=Mucilaginibacter sp. UR6-1 TaxID=1435643 RepID=UPI001E4FB686|nr:hypothetical protein [Mucilaginibacter sp. UR6-1]MCC8408638.1 hypothetical protein [Mucilaginibacter sp. UR6-1]
MKRLLFAIITCIAITQPGYAQLGGLLKKGSDMLGSSGLNLNKIIKQPAAITTNFKDDAIVTGSKPPSFQEGVTAQPLYLLPKATGGGYILCAGLYEMTSYEEMEKYAVLAGIAPNNNSEYPSGTWALHPDGYYIRYIPQGYSITKVQIFVPKELIDKAGNDPIIYDAPYGIACPANVGAQRLAQTNEPLEPDYTKKLTTICDPKK